MGRRLSLDDYTNVSQKNLEAEIAKQERQIEQANTKLDLMKTALSMKTVPPEQCVGRYYTRKDTDSYDEWPITIQACRILKAPNKKDTYKEFETITVRLELDDDQVIRACDISPHDEIGVEELYEHYTECDSAHFQQLYQQALDFFADRLHENLT